MSIYLDNSATTPVREEVVETIVASLRDGWGNASSIHSVGRQAAKALKKARAQVSSMLQCQPEEVYFSSGGTMSNNVTLLGRARFAEANGQGRHLITTRIEHPSVLGPAQYLESQGWKVTYLPVDKQGFISLDVLEKSCTKETSIISVMWANNEVGTLQDIQSVATFAKDRDIFVHTDAVQVPGKLAIDVQTTPLSALSLSGHKFYAPKGIGLLFLRRQNNVMPIVFGGGQEMGLFPGTEGLANIAAIGMASELAAIEQKQNSEHLRKMACILDDALLSVEGMKVSGPADHAGRLPGHCSYYLPAVEGESLVMRADLKGVCISSGSACHKGIIEASTVLRALNFSDEDAMGAIRVTAGRFTTEEECRQAAQILADVLKTAKKQEAAARAS
jgi:cysteine desulfurase